MQQNLSNNQDLIMVGISGGVDSSVAAWLLQQQGLSVAGLFMKNWEEDDSSNHCSATEDLNYAMQVCDMLGIQLHTVNFASEYWDTVFSHFLAEYQAYRTPNPDILCNNEIKFKVFLEYAKILGATKIATGHYAKVSYTGNYYQLSKSIDLNKDQSYFLHALSQTQLKQAIFPLAEFTKIQVRDMAKKAGLPNFAKKDSTGICFIGERKFKNFLQNYLPAQPGIIVDTAGKQVGTHDGLMYYTIGQRQGLQIGGLRDTANIPWYVVKKNIAANELIVAQGNNHPELFAEQLLAHNLTWIQGAPPANVNKKFACHAKIRYRQVDQACEVWLQENNTCVVKFLQPQRAVTPGQYVVFYHENKCLGGGMIVTTNGSKEN